MSNYNDTVNEMVARCRRIGWPVEMAPEASRAAWAWKISPPNLARAVYIHRTPNANWDKVCWRQLRAAGFDEAEQVYLAQVEADRQQALAAEREKAEAKAAKLAKQSKALTTAAGKYAGPQEVDLAWLTTPTPWPETKVVIMTPQAAKHLLDTANTHNRKRSDARVDYFVELIQTGQMRCTHQGGATDSNGVLQDGQSRLEAIVRLDTPVMLQWSVGMPPENFTALDSGGPRTARDVAFIMGEADPGAISAAARILVVVDRYGPDAYIKSRSRMANDKVAAAIGQYGDELRAAVTYAKEIRRDVKRASPAGLAAGIFLIARQLRQEDPRLKRFLEDLRFGLDGRKHGTDPVYRLRKALLDGPSDNRRHYDQYEQVALIVRAWNMRAMGKKSALLTWRRDTAFPSTPVLPPPINDDVHWAALLADHA